VFEFIRKGSFKKLSLASILFLLFLFLANSNLYRLEKENFSQAHFSLGNLFLKKWYLKKAEEQYLLALEISPFVKRAHLNLGNIYFNKGYYSLAEKEFFEELKTYPQEEKAYNNLSALYRIKGDYSQAIGQAKKALKAKPYYLKAYINLFLAYLREENYTLAESTLTATTTLYPPPSGMRFYMGLLYQTQGKLKEALEEYELLLREREKTPEREYNIGLIFSQDDPAKEGLSGLKAYSSYNSGVIYIQRNELELAQKSLIQSIKFKPDFAEAHAALGHVYELMREYQLAIKELKEFLKLNPNDPIYHYNLGLIYAKTENFLSAREELQTALKLLPEFELAIEKLRLVDSLLSLKSSK
jgi:tetratricopeptide (TPR) repeat protein